MEAQLQFRTQREGGQKHCPETLALAKKAILPVEPHAGTLKACSFLFFVTFVIDTALSKLRDKGAFGSCLVGARQ